MPKIIEASEKKGEARVVNHSSIARFGSKKLEENSNLKVDKLQLENEVSKLRYDNMACQVLKRGN